MIEAEGIGGISISFTTGVAIAAFFGNGDWAPVLLPLCALALVLTAAHDGRPIFPVLLLFLLVGMFCRCNAFLCPGGAIPVLPSRFRDGLCRLIDSVPFGQKETPALVKALLAGVREGLGDGAEESFRKSGAAHLLALSGLHLGVIYSILHSLLSIVGNGRKAACVRALSVIIICALYTLATGAGPSLCRAFLFISLNEIAALNRERKRSPAAIMSASLLIQLTFSPSVLESVGFQLSYLAVCGIIFVYPRLESLYPGSGNGMPDRLDPFARMWKMMALSISCQLFTGALAFYRFGTFPKYFLLTNLIALPLCEALIVCAVFCTVATAAGFCPQCCAHLADTLARMLESALGIISSM